MVIQLNLEKLNENACNHEEAREAFRVANANFEKLGQAVEQLVSDLEQIRRTCVRPT